MRVATLARVLLLPRHRALATMTLAQQPQPSAHTTNTNNHLPADLTLTEHTLTVPLDHAKPHGPTIDLFVRELVPRSKAHKRDELPALLFLQGGPGFPSARPSVPPSGWQKAALQNYRVLLLDQRGTGRSTPATPQALLGLGSAVAQAEWLSQFRADSIVRDCEVVRSRLLADGGKLTLLGQSFGGFCILSYLSLFPHAVEHAIFTFGLAPVGVDIDDVYRATYKRMESRNERFYRRYPGDVELVRSLVCRLHNAPVPLPRGGMLTARRFLQLGLLLGSASGLESLHDLLELARVPAPGDELPQLFLHGVENAQSQFETNPIYWLLHESIYCDGGGRASNWAAERVQASLGDAWDYRTRLSEGDSPIQLTGEMVYSWMGDDYGELRRLKPAAELLAAKADWPRLYDEEGLGSSAAACAALVSYDDIYVERAFSEGTSRLLRECRLWISNEFQHSGLRDKPEVFDKLVDMAKGDLEF